MKYHHLAALAMACLASTGAFAASDEIVQSVRLLQIGNVEAPESAAESLNQRMSLLQATNSIIPADWSAYAQKGVDVARVVSVNFKRGTPWTKTLDALLQQQKLFSVVDWDAKSVYLRMTPADGKSVQHILSTNRAQPARGAQVASRSSVPAQGRPAATQAQPGAAAVGYMQPAQGQPPAAYPHQNQQPGSYAAPSAYGPPGWVPAGYSTFSVQRTDHTLRDVVQRWSAQAGWSFEPSYWAAPKDLPVAGTSAFNGTFEEAVIALLNSTRLTDMPVKPCFYTNRVVRVQIATSRCDWSSPDLAENQ